MENIDLLRLVLNRVPFLNTSNCEWVGQRLKAFFAGAEVANAVMARLKWLEFDHYPVLFIHGACEEVDPQDWPRDHLHVLGVDTNPIQI